MVDSHKHPTLRSFALTTLALAVGGVACNPGVYDDLIEQAWVETFTLRGPTSGNAHGRHALAYQPLDDGEGHVLIASSADSGMTWLRIDRVGSPHPEYASLEQLKALIPDIDTVEKAQIGGLVAVPAPDGSPNQHALVAFKDPGSPEVAHTERFRVPDFAKASGGHIVAPVVEGTYVGSFGEGLAAINLDSGNDQDDPDYEVLVGSDKGVLLFDNMGRNDPEYAANRDAAVEAGTITDANEEQGYGFTRCAELAVRNGVTAGQLLPDRGPVFVVATTDGLTFVGGQDSGPNLVGAPIYDCNVRTIAAPADSGIGFGFTLLAADLDWDAFSGDAEGYHDLVVGDPSGNRVHVYLGANDGLPGAPSVTLSPPDSGTAEFGYAVGRANLGGSIGHVLLVGAPGSAVGGKNEVGRVYVYDAMSFDLITMLEDQEPASGTRHGQWVGGIAHEDWQHDELLVLGYTEGRVHLAINADDSAAGNPP